MQLPNIMSFMRRREIFQALQKDFLENVTLNTLVPELNSEDPSLLSPSDEQYLLNQHLTEHDRVLELTTSILPK